MKVCIHRGTRQIGGTCVEIEASGRRIIVDLGLPLDAVVTDPALLPQISGLREPDPSLLAIVLSHGHRDHWGLIPKACPAIPIVMGRAAERIMRAASDFMPDAFAPNAWKYLESGRPLRIGPFVIRPHLVDHSGFDAYALEVEADGRRLFYYGDLRGHGRKGELFKLMLSNPPRNIDVMLMEGSSLGRLDAGEQFPTEKALERLFMERFQATSGIVLVACSAQNIDRIVTIYGAAKKTHRTLIVDAYAAEVLKATGYDSIPKPARGWSNIAAFIPQRQRIQLVKKNIAPIVDSYRALRVWPEQLAERAFHSVMLFRPWMLGDLERAGALTGASVIWSQWAGYLADGSGAQLKINCQSRGIPSEIIHTSGHASVGDLKRLAESVNPRALVPIHMFNGERFPALFDKCCAPSGRSMVGGMTTFITGDVMSEPREVFVEKLMSHILDLTMIPKVQVERAIGPILGLFIAELLSTEWSKHVEMICEEFPLLKASDGIQTYQSTNIDWLLYNRCDHQLVFLELKTAYASFDQAQLDTYYDVKEKIEKSGSSFLVTNLKGIMDASRAGKKYEEVRKCFQKDPCYSNCRKAKVVYLAPSAMGDAQRQRTGSKVEWLSFTDLPEKITGEFAVEWEIIHRKLVELDSK